MEISLFHHLLFFLKNNSCLIIDYNNNMNSFFVYYLVRFNGITNVVIQNSIVNLFFFSILVYNQFNTIIVGIHNTKIEFILKAIINNNQTTTTVIFNRK